MCLASVKTNEAADVDSLPREQGPSPGPQGTGERHLGPPNVLMEIAGEEGPEGEGLPSPFWALGLQ